MNKIHEDKIRRAANRQGFRLVKSRRRDPRAISHGCCMLTDTATNTVVMGVGPTGEPGADLKEVEAYLTRPLDN